MSSKNKCQGCKEPHPCRCGNCSCSACKEYKFSTTSFGQNFSPPPNSDKVNHPKHYTSHPSGIECITIVEHMSFCIGSAIKYLFRVDLKEDGDEDIRKAIWYLNRELERRKNLRKPYGSATPCDCPPLTDTYSTNFGPYPPGWTLPKDDK